MKKLIPFSVFIDTENGIEVNISEKDQHCVFVDKNLNVVDNKDSAVAILKYALSYEFCDAEILKNATKEDLTNLFKAATDQELDNSDDIEALNEIKRSLIIFIIGENHDNFVDQVSKEVAAAIEAELIRKKFSPLKHECWFGDKKVSYVVRASRSYYRLNKLESTEKLDTDEVCKFADWFARQYIYSLLIGKDFYPQLV